MTEEDPDTPSRISAADKLADTERWLLGMRYRSGVNGSRYYYDTIAFTRLELQALASRLYADSMRHQHEEPAFDRTQNALANASHLLSDLADFLDVWPDGEDDDGDA